jgi:hypothetical protein
MVEMYLLTAAALITGGITTSIITIVALGIHREERDGSLMNHTTNRVLRGTRRATGFYSCITDSADVRELRRDAMWSRSHG